MSNNENKIGHPVLGIVLGIIGLLLAIPCTLLFGLIGGIVAGVLGLIAILLGVLARSKGGKGVGAIVTGILAVVLAVVMTSTSIGLVKTLQDIAKDHADVAPHVSKYIGEANPNMGFVGVVFNIPQDEASLQEILDELNELNKLDGTDKPAEATAQ